MRLREAFDRRVDVARLLVVERVSASLEIPIERARRARAGSGQRLALGVVQPHGQHAQGPRRDAVLEGERITHARGRGERVDLPERRGVDEHVVDPHRVRGSQDAAFEDQRCAELPPRVSPRL